MTKSTLLAAAALLASALAAPAMAQEVVANPGYCAQFYPNANCQNRGAGNPTTGSYQRQAYSDQAYQDRAWRSDRGWRNSYNRWDEDDGSTPGRVAAGVAAGAIGTATYPIGAEVYARRNGFVCMPGTTFRGEDGRMHLCQ